MSKVCIGKVMDAHGLKGEIKVRFISEEPEWIEDLFRIQLGAGEEFKGQALTSFEVIAIRSTNQLWILQLEDLTDRTQAEALKGQFVYVDQSFFQTDSDDEPYLLELKGYQVQVGGAMQGVVIGFLETAAHNLILLKSDKGEFEIPWVPAFIKNIDRDQKIIDMDFPLDLLSDEYNTKD